MRAASALLAVLDPKAEFDLRFDGALLIASALADLDDIRSIFMKRDE
jgi:hypothetical protein